MKIVFAENEIDRIASDDADGKFYPGKDGVILYLGPGEAEPWYVNAGLEQFRRSVEAYENYGSEVVTQETEEEQLKVVAKFREAVLAIENHGYQNKSFWACIVQQAEDGQM
jgi:hypothetical protein